MAHVLRMVNADHLFTVLYLLGIVSKALLPRRGGRLLSLARAEADLLVQFCGEEKTPELGLNSTGAKGLN